MEVVQLGRPNGLAFSCRERAAQGEFKNRTISRAKRSAAMPCWAYCALSGQQWQIYKP